jgi:hypothetical protein
MRLHPQDDRWSLSICVSKYHEKNKNLSLFRDETWFLLNLSTGISVFGAGSDSRNWGMVIITRQHFTPRVLSFANNAMFQYLPSFEEWVSSETENIERSRVGKSRVDKFRAILPAVCHSCHHSEYRYRLDKTPNHIS